MKALNCPKSLALLLLAILECLGLSGCSHHHFVRLFNKSHPLAEFNSWVVLSKDDLLIASSEPQNSTSNNQHRNLHYLMIVYDTKKHNYVVSVVAGDTLKEGGSLLVKLGPHQYYLPVYQDRAWLTNKDDVNNFLKDLQSGYHVTIISAFNNGTIAYDNYSSEGFNSCAEILMLKPPAH